MSPGRTKSAQCQGKFHVRVMARGKLHSRLDPFLSPARRVIEDWP
ncbi:MULTISPECIES: Imm7 family immunity protein [unclassified Streptomyces]|nr:MULTISPECIES: Imm7 family immunity protein [unclassified Streptomyces]